MLKNIYLAICLGALVVAHAVASDAYEIDGLVDSDKDTCLLLITCANGSRVEVKMKRSRLDKIKVDKLHEELLKACKEGRDDGPAR